MHSLYVHTYNKYQAHSILCIYFKYIKDLIIVGGHLTYNLAEIQNRSTVLSFLHLFMII